MCQPTTECVPMYGQGFEPGAYYCHCKKGYYFPNTAESIKAYTGVNIEGHFRSVGHFDDVTFRCVACAAGCDTCWDSSPCLHERNRALVITILLLNCITVCGILVIAILTYYYRHEMIIKSASPIFLELSCLGAVLICIQNFFEYSDATVVWCSVRIWPLHAGFFVLYGSLILKTWRISMIFTVGTHKRVRLPDQVLLQRYALLVFLVLIFLAVWTGTKSPTVEVLVTSDNLKFHYCNYGPWEYGIISLEIVFLLYGVYLCFTVRQAPPHYNESKHITWATYNAIILGSFTSLLSRLFISVLGPDLMLLLQMLQIQVYTTITVLLIFAPKFHALIKKTAVEQQMPNQFTTQHTMKTITGRTKKNQILPIIYVSKAHKGTQTLY
ncbi:hypothetical protein DPMN_086765 [Dreissena polymorpha]|uniref:G-protein coupled receptors family 3 profile domain-containing protein n=1 Tax=Dreissena polymorpha TaxID=45954 RepID=A0A9D4KR18_DREPO|nr:hypothetical protein DPMN_086765 [Dreissena polymorpha]